MRYLIALLALALVLTLAAPGWGQDLDFPRSVLITNDDGIDDPGLRALVRAFAPQVRTFVVAPMENRSGSTNYISAFARPELQVERRDLGEGVIAYAVDGYPADAVALALGGLLAERPDIVISGVNGGPNLANAWSLSGTVGAVRAAASLGVRAVAVSGYSADLPETLDAAARWVVELTRSDLVSQLQPGDYLTVSVPRVAVELIEGVVVARRSAPVWTLAFERQSESEGRETWRMSIRELESTREENTDAALYPTHRIVIVPMRMDEHHYDLLEKLGGGTGGAPAWPPKPGS